MIGSVGVGVGVGARVRWEGKTPPSFTRMPSCLKWSRPLWIPASWTKGKSACALRDCLFTVRFTTSSSKRSSKKPGMPCEWQLNARIARSCKFPLELNLGTWRWERSLKILLWVRSSVRLTWRKCGATSTWLVLKVAASSAVKRSTSCL